MTSDSDDLEQQLQQNLKLRRELGAEVAKAAKQGGGFAYRLSWVLYWICLLLALMSGLYVLYVLAMTVNTGSILDLLAAWVAVLAVYGLGRAFRYVLSGE